VKRTLSISVLLLVLGGCATTYQPHGFSGGFVETLGDENFAEIRFAGNGYTSKEKALDFSLLRAAEFTLEKKFKYFRVIDSKYTVAALKPIAVKKIKMLSEETEDNSPYNAEYILDSLEKKYGLATKQFASEKEETAFVNYLEQPEAINIQLKREAKRKEIETKQKAEEQKQALIAEYIERCIEFGFEGKTEIATCFQQEVFNERQLAQQRLTQQSQLAQEEEVHFLLQMLGEIAEGVSEGYLEQTKHDMVHQNDRRPPIIYQPKP